MFQQVSVASASTECETDMNVAELRQLLILNQERMDNIEAGFHERISSLERQLAEKGVEAGAAAVSPCECMIRSHHLCT